MTGLERATIYRVYMSRMFASVNGSPRQITTVLKVLLKYKEY